MELRKGDRSTLADKLDVDKSAMLELLDSDLSIGEKEAKALESLIYFG